MAERLGRAVLELATDSGTFNADLDKTEKRVVSLTTSFDAARAPLEKLVAGMTAAGKQANASGQLIAGLGAAGKTAADQFAKMNAPLSTLVTGLTAAGKVSVESSRLIAGMGAAGQEAAGRLKTLGTAAKETEGPVASMGTSFGKLVASFVTAQAIIGGVKAAFSTVVGFITDSIKAAADAEKAHASLSAALRAQGTAIPSVITAYQGYASALEKTTVFQDDALEGAMALLTQVGNVMPRDMQKALRATTELASGLGKDLNEAAMMVAKAAEGNTTAFKKLGVQTEDTKGKALDFSIVLDNITDKFGGQAAAMAGTYEGRLKQLGNTWNNVEESIGRVLTQNQTLLDAFAFLNRAIGDNTIEFSQNQAATNLVSDAIIIFVKGVSLAGQVMQVFSDKLTSTAVQLVGFERFLVDAAKTSIVYAKAMSIGSPMLQALADVAMQAVVERGAAVEQSLLRIGATTINAGKLFEGLSADADALAKELDKSRGKTVAFMGPLQSTADLVEAARLAWEKHTLALKKGADAAAATAKALREEGEAWDFLQKKQADAMKETADALQQGAKGQTDFIKKWLAAQNLRQQTAGLIRLDIDPKPFLQTKELIVREMGTMTQSLVDTSKEDWAAIAANTKASLQDQADAARATYQYMAANAGLFTASTIAHFKDLAIQAAAAMGSLAAKITIHLTEALQGIPQLFINAFTGGGGILGALKGIGVSLVSAITKDIFDPIMRSFATWATRMNKSIGNALSSRVQTSLTSRVLGGTVGNGGGSLLGAGTSLAAGITPGLIGGGGIAAGTVGLGGVATITPGLIGGTSGTAGAVGGSVALSATTLGIGAAAIGVALLVKHWLAVRRAIKEAKAAQDELVASLRAAGATGSKIEVLAQGIHRLGLEGLGASTLLEQLMDTKHPQRFQAALARVTAELKALDEATQKYGLTWRDMTAPGERLAGFQREFGALIADFGRLSRAGYSTSAIMKAMGPDFIASLRAAKKSGVLDTFIDDLVRTGRISEEVGKKLRHMADTVDYQELEDRANHYGITLEQLGPKFEQANISRTATTILTDFNDLIDAGGEINGVMIGMSDEVSTLLQNAKKFGSSIPTAMKPMLDTMLGAGLLVDENGDKLKDLSGITFADSPLEQGLHDLTTAINDLILTLGGVPSALEDIANTRIPPIHVPVEIDYPAGGGGPVTVAPPNIPGGPGGGGDESFHPGYARGTPRLDYLNFGRASFVPLHGMEAVIPQGSGSQLAGEIATALGATGTGTDAAILDALHAIEQAVRVGRQTSVQIDGREVVQATHRVYDNGGAPLSNLREIVGTR